jgi:hypothetical protein
MSDFPWKLARPYTRAQARLETTIPSLEHPLGLPRFPFNPNVVSIFAD